LLSKFYLELIRGASGNKTEFFKNTKENDDCKPLILRRDIAPFLINFEERFLLYDRDRLHRPRSEWIFLSKKIIMQRIKGKRCVVAAIDENQYYTYDSVNNLILKEDCPFSYEYLVAILNSDLINWYYDKNFVNDSSLTVNITKMYLSVLPIAIPTPQQEKQIKQLVEEYMKQPSSDILKLINNKIYDLYDIKLENRSFISKSFED